jgi:hypothetical protein
MNICLLKWKFITMKIGENVSLNEKYTFWLKYVPKQNYNSYYNDYS